MDKRFAVLVVLAAPGLAHALNDSVFVSQNVPLQVERGAAFAVELTFANAGDTTWSIGNEHYLGSENPMDNATWGTNRVFFDPADSVPPGSSFTFHATLHAPDATGTFDFQWRMLQDAVEWFGQTSDNLVIEVIEVPVVVVPPLTCDGTEVVCLDLTSQAAVEASGGANVGGDFTAEGFMPYNGGGLDWAFGPGRNFSAGELEVDVTGLVPGDGEELGGGKVSIFEMCGSEPQTNEGVGLQKMEADYRDGHIFRYGMDDDGLADNWDAAIITGADFGCYYSIANPTWQAGETHHFRARWSTDGLELWIDDDLHCNGWGNGDTFDPANKLFTLANRCTHYSNQQAVARFTNFRLWARGVGACGDGTVDVGEACDGDCPAGCDDGLACTTDTQTGSSATCDTACVHVPVEVCGAGDGCCPAGCTQANDGDCAVACGDGVVGAGETCDGDCPSACADGDACTTDTLTGSAAACTASCAHAPVTACGADACCVAICAADPDCEAGDDDSGDDDSGDDDSGDDDSGDDDSGDDDSGDDDSGDDDSSDDDSGDDDSGDDDSGDDDSGDDDSSDDDSGDDDSSDDDSSDDDDAVPGAVDDPGDDDVTADAEGENESGGCSSRGGRPDPSGAVFLLLGLAIVRRRRARP